MILNTLTPDQQTRMVATIRALIQAAPLYRAEANGRPFRYQQSGAGWGWTSGHGGGYRYQRQHPVTGELLPAIPDALLRLAAHYGLEADALLINFYTEGSSLGLHQDKDERDLTAPVLSISLGDTAEFELGGRRRSDPTQVLELGSGTILALAGDSRLAWHGIRRIRPGTGPAGLLTRPGRLNLTFRKSQ